MKKQSFYLILTIVILGLSSCSKEEEGDSSVNSGPYPTTSSLSSPNTMKNTQPNGCGTYYPMFKNSWIKFSKNGSVTDTSLGIFSGNDTTINGTTYTKSETSTFDGFSTTTLTGYTRRDGSKIISYSYLSPQPYEQILLDESKSINQEWDAGEFTITQNTGSGQIETTNKYTSKIIAKLYVHRYSDPSKIDTVKLPSGLVFIV